MITIETLINSTIENTWDAYMNPERMIHWNFAGEDWHSPQATNDLSIGGKRFVRMEAKDGSFGFDLIGFYDEIIPDQKIQYHLEDNRKVVVTFETTEHGVRVVEQFDPENENSEEMQRAGWLMILENFRKHAESTH
jgi:uncharacterized protein YndB with AHSA1/START domain